MKTWICLFVATVLPFSGCDKKGPEAPGSAGSAVGTARDNTAVNERDRNPAAMTPIDQNENKKDVNITAEIRQRVVDTKMSVEAQNVKIITQDGRVTLRGPVNSTDEKVRIETMAREVAGPTNVESYLEVVAQ